VATTLIITNDFPPRIGGIESFVSDLAELLDGDVVVYTSGPPGAADSDAARGYPVIRDGRLLLPSRRVGRRAVELFVQHRCRRVIFGAAAPLGLLAPVLRQAGAAQILALTHGHETWWATVPPTRRLLRRIGNGCDHLTTISDYTTRRIAPALTPKARAALRRLPPPVDTDLFRPARDRDRSGAAPPRCVAVGRFIGQKGFDVLLRAWALVVAAHAGAGTASPPPPELVLVGDGPQRRRLERLVEHLSIVRSVRFTGPLDRPGVIAELQRAQLFALPVRTRFTGLFPAGLNPEGLGLAALEAAACGLPVLIGRSGGAPETVRDGITGFVVDPDRPADLATRIGELLSDPARAEAMGRAGRCYVQQHFSVARARMVLREILDPG
jgi:phosphatidylinositol alpha-1,6-mannosyltransferase